MRKEYPNFAALSRAEMLGRDYAIHVEKPDSPVAIIAPHGGSIEFGTSRIATAIAGTDYRSYRFEGIASRNNGRLHITSRNFDEPKCVELIKDCEHVVAIHGLRRTDVELVEVGGLAEKLRDAICAALKAAGFDAQVMTTDNLAGRDPRNICNRGNRNAGVQLEISGKLRAKLKKNKQLCNNFAAAVRQAIEKV